MLLTAVAAMDQRGGIGLRGGLPWPRLPRDLARFRELTLGKAVLMGRTTYAGLGRRTLPGRHLIVLSHDPAFDPGEVWVARSLEHALAKASLFGDEAILAGGEQIYREALPRCERLRLTLVQGAWEADAWWPWRAPGGAIFGDLGARGWTMRLEAMVAAGDESPLPLEFWDCTRKAPAGERKAA